MENVDVLVGGILAAIAIVFVAYLAIEGDARKAGENTSKRAVGVFSGAFGSAIAALVVGLEALLTAPDLLITLLGIGAIFAGVSWEVFGATAFVVFLLGQTVNGVGS